MATNKVSIIIILILMLRADEADGNAITFTGCLLNHKTEILFSFPLHRL